METIEFKAFSLGRIVQHLALSKPFLIPACECLDIHMHVDWGNVCSEDAADNNLSTHNGFRILSA